MDPARQIAVCYGRSPQADACAGFNQLYENGRIQERPAGRMCGASSKQFGRTDQAVHGRRALASSI
jgi:hypothetical protein